MAASFRRKNRFRPIFHAESLRSLDYRLDGAACHQDAASGFEDAPGIVIENDLRVTAPQICERKLFKYRACLFERGNGGEGIRLVLVRDPKHACAAKKSGLAGFVEKLLPERKRAHGPARVDFVGAIAHADDAGFAAGTCAGVRGAVGVEERD